MGRRAKRCECERRRKGGSATFDRGQVRVGTRFALNENEASYLPAVLLSLDAYP